MTRFARYSLSLVSLSLVTFVPTWVGSKFYVRRQIVTSVADLRALDNSPDPTALSDTLMKKYADHFVGKHCEADYCSNEFVFSNRVLSRFYLAPRSEININFETVRGSVRDIAIEYSSAVFQENSPIVRVSETFCTDQASYVCHHFVMNPHGKNVSQNWNGDVSFGQGSKPEIRRAGWSLNADCFTALRGCRDVSELLPTLWKVTAPGTVSSRVRSDSDSIAEASQPLAE